MCPGAGAPIRVGGNAAGRRRLVPLGVWCSAAADSGVCGERKRESLGRERGREGGKEGGREFREGGRGRETATETGKEKE